MVELHEGDSAEVLKTFPDNHVDSVVTDPPAGIAFMGAEWDSNKGGRDEWITWLTDVLRETTRVMKPGAHALVWALPRTSHWTATAIENAGLEIRDIITHHFGTGFPKGQNISKAIDKSKGNKREVIGHKPSSVTNSKLFRDDGWQPDLDKLSEVTAPASELAKKFDGWNTSLKPATEHWILCRKPLEGTVAENVEKWGTGGINIDACRIGDETRINPAGAFGPNCCGQLARNNSARVAHGRYPSNAMFSNTAVKELDNQSGIGKSPKQYIRSKYIKGESRVYANGRGMPPLRDVPCYEDEGGASRFFYCPKASRKDRGEGNDHPTVKSTQLMRYLVRLITPPGGTVLDPFMGSGSTGKAATLEGFNFIGIEKNNKFFIIATKRLK